MIPRKQPIVVFEISVLNRTSEKARIPAWTDRILWKGSNLRQTAYGSVPLRFSDHRPVYAIFQCSVSIIDAAIRDSLSREIYSKRRAYVGNTVASARDDETDDEDIIGYDSIEPSLPPASSDRRKWWLDNSQPARSTVKAAQRGAVPNPNRPSNPFIPTDEPDWVTISKPGRTESYRSTTSSVASTATEPRGRVPTPRKLPPHLEPAHSLPNNIRVTSITKDVSADQSSPSLPPRRLSNASSQASSLSKKTPPPIAKKPVHLSASETGPSPTGPMRVLNGSSNSVYSSSTRSMAGVRTDFPPPPRRAIDGPAEPLPPRRAVDGPAEPPPPPQPRRPGTQNSSKGLVAGADGLKVSSPPVDLLGDDEEVGLKGWEALKPST
jgi:hypothetical protein